MYAQHLLSQEPDALSSNSSQQQTSYTVKKGDTLWDIARKFLGDSFGWPDIWHKNTHIKNPDLIYPGNEILLAYSRKLRRHPIANTAASDASATSAASETEDTDRASDASTAAGLPAFPTVSTFERPSSEFEDSIMAFTMYKQDYFCQEFLDKLAFLWFEKDSRGLICPGNAVIENAAPNDPFKKYDKETYQQFDEIHGAVFGKNIYAVGDTIDVYHSERLVKFMGKTANLVRRVAKARVASVSGSSLTAVLFKAWDIVSGGDRIDKTFRIQGKEIDTIVGPEKTLKGTVFERVEDTESPYLFQTFICDLGARDGVVFGDLFFAYTQGIAHPSLLGCAVNVGEQSSTIAIEKMFTNSMHPGDTLALVGHIRFK